MSQTPKLPLTTNFRTVEILEKALKANTALAELNGLIYSLPNPEIILQPLTVREAVASSEIENIRTTTEQIFEAEAIGEKLLIGEQKEVLNYKKALLAGFKKIKSKNALDPEDILKIHDEIESHKKGFRKTPGTVIMNTRTGEILHKPPQKYEEIVDLMENLCTYINSEQKEDDLVKAAIAHHQFETIHPFYDGNGRSGRILMVLQLVLSGRLNFPALFLSGYILNSKQVYYLLLQRVRKNGEWLEWVEYILEGIESTSKYTCEIVSDIVNLKKMFEENLAKSLPKLDKTWIVNYLFSKVFYTQKDFIETTKVSKKTAHNYFSEFKEKNILEFRKVGKYKLYYIPEFLEIMK